MIKVEHLTKRYGNFLAVDDLSFEIGEGQVYGLLGPNGAGKSTTMNIMTGCLSASEGSVSIGSHDIYEEPLEAKKLIGYLPEQPPLYMNETPYEYLRFVGEAKGYRGKDLDEQIQAVAIKTGIEGVCNCVISTLSKGYKQRVGIAQALLGNPQVIILDEPTVGLDPIQIIEIRELIRSLGETHTVILSSHILSEVQAICGQVLIISHGKLIAFDSPENLERLMTRCDGIEFRVREASEKLSEILDSNPQISHWESQALPNGTFEILADTDLEDTEELRNELFFSCASSGIAILEMRTRHTSFEDVFVGLTDQSVEQSILEAQKNRESSIEEAGLEKVSDASDTLVQNETNRGEQPEATGAETPIAALESDEEVHG